MTQFHATIDARRRALGLTYEAVHQRLLDVRWPAHVEPPSLPTVGHWFNGTRRPRDMEHLKALCDVLDLSIDEAVRGRPSEAVTGLEGAMLETLRALPPEQGQALLALASSMVKKAETPSDQ